MLTEERFTRILSILESMGSVTVQQLMTELDASESTIRRDLNTLDANGQLIKVHGGAILKNTSYSTEDDEVMQRRERNKGAKEKIAKYASGLIEPGDFVYHIIRLRFLDKKPHLIDISYMPISLIPNLKLEHLKGSIYQYIEKELKLKIQSTHKTIRAHLSSPLEQENLGLKEYEPYIEVEQTAYLSSGIIFEYSFTRYHYNNFELQTVTVQ